MASSPTSASPIVQVAFTVSRLVAGVATLMTQDLRVIEFPVALLPPDVKEGQTVRVHVAHNDEDDQRRLSRFRVVQESILHDYSRLPTWNNVASKAGHETIMISWNPPSLFTATPNQIRVLLNGAVVQSLLPSTTFLRLSHLAINTDYHVELVLLSSAGKSSHSLDIKTSGTKNLSSIMLAFYCKTNEELAEMQQMAARAGVAYSSTLSVETTTHLVSSRTAGDRITTANKCSIPIVTVQWLQELCSVLELPLLPTGSGTSSTSSASSNSSASGSPAILPTNTTS